MPSTNRVRGHDKVVRKTHDVKGNHRDWNDRRGLQHHEDALVLEAASLADFPTPRWMTVEEKEVFEELRSLVVDANIAKKTDAIALRLLAQRYTAYVELCEAIREMGLIMENVSKDGNVRRTANPLLSARDSAFNQSKGLLVEFGLTPSSRRTVLKADPDRPDNSEENEWDDLLN